MKHQAHPPARQAWYSSLRAHSALMEVFERELQQSSGIPLAWYDVLAVLYLAPDQQMRMCDLAQEVLTSRSWLTRRIDQLVEAGLVQRVTATGDGRGIAAQLTREGRRVFIKIERIHAASIDKHFGSHLSDQDARILIAVMDRIGVQARKQAGVTAQANKPTE
jgi:DNA-binding MarR family transcriptional regulator